MENILDSTTMAAVAQWFFAFGDDHPEIFPVEDLTGVFIQARENSEGDRPKLVANLRLGLLKLLRRDISGCEKCGLCAHRLSSRPVVDDGSYRLDFFSDLGKPAPLASPTARIMMIGEGPGQYEQRCGQPLVGYQTLAGSLCATMCANFNICYPQAETLPKAPCKPKGIPEDKRAEVAKANANRPFHRVHTAGEILDQALIKSGLWRESWNPRIEMMDNAKTQAKPGTVYLTNTVKCRSASEMTVSIDGLKDRAPMPEQVSACRPYLDLQIRIMQPAVIVTLGKVATCALLQLKDFKMTGNGRGVPVYSPEGYLVIPEVHPSYVLRQGTDSVIKEWVGKMAETFQLAQNISAGKVQISENPAPSILNAEFPPTTPEEVVATPPEEEEESDATE